MKLSEVFQREIKFYPSWDKRSEDPAKNYGVHGAELAFYLKGSKGVVQFKISTGWMLESLREENPESYGFKREPLPIDLGYHSPIPRYENHRLLTDQCELLDGKPCYYDGSSLNADPVFETLISGGSEAVWKKLEEYYHDIFDKNEAGGFLEILASMLEKK